MQSLTETNWNSWNPSAHDKGDPTGQVPPQVLRMDNLMLDDMGILRMVRGHKQEAINQFPASDIYTIFSTILNGLKTRFVYANQGTTNKAILCTSTTPRNFDTTLISQAETSLRCAFLNVMGQVIMCAGGIQRKYDGTHNFALGIAAPSPPTLSSNATFSVDLNNYDGSGHYTNWTSVISATFNNAGTTIFGTGLAVPSSLANNFNFQTVFSSPVDTTNLNGTGKNLDSDIFQFTLEVDDVTQLAWVEVQLFMQTPPTGNDYWWKFWQFDVTDPNNPYFPFAISSGVNTSVQLRRDEWLAVGNPNWTAVKAIRVTIGVTGSTNVTWSAYSVFGGTDSNLSDAINYVAVAADNNNGLYEFSPASTVVSVSNLNNQSVHITPAGAVPSNANEYWIFRQDTTGGLYFRVANQSGAYGFTPTAFTDTRKLVDIINDANINYLYNLQFFRTALPNNIVDMIWFRDRVIYLNANGFIPAFKLDPGSYDSRFVYEVVGANNENCLFIAKLDVGTFIVATNVDFYRVTGTFAIQIDPSDPTGNTQFQDVTIVPLGIKSPAASRAWTEFQGGIIYVAVDGVRILYNGTSTLFNDNIDLLFRREARHELPPFQIFPRDLSQIAVVSYGQRVYFSLPHTDGVNRIYVLNIANQTNAMNLDTRSWRMITLGERAVTPISLAREEDGTILFGGRADPLNYIYSLENEFSNIVFLPVKFRTQYNYFGSTDRRKDLLGFKCKIDTGGNIANLVIKALLYDGSTTWTTVQFTALGDSILSIDLKAQTLTIAGFTATIPMGVAPAIAYAVELSSLTNWFKLQWFTWTFEPRPQGIRRAIIYADNMESAGRKRIAQWPFSANPLGLVSNAPTNITARMTADGALLPDQIFTGPANVDLPQTFRWQVDQTKDLLATDWQLELIGDEEFELHKFLPPVVTQKTPELIFQTISPGSDFGTAGRKRIGAWPFVANLRGSSINVIVRVDNITLPIQTFTKGDEINTFEFLVPNDTLGVDWEIEINITAGIGMEFYKFMDPIILEVKPPVTIEAYQATTNFDSAGRKRVSSWPFIVNNLGNSCTGYLRVDGIDQTPVVFPALNTDDIQTIEFIPPKDLLGVDWQLRVYNASTMEFYKFLPPNVSQPFPAKTKHAIQPSTNLGKGNLKQITVWPFMANLLGNTLNVKVTVDGTIVQPIQRISGSEGTTLQTYFWRSIEDTVGIDWQIEVYPDDTTDSTTGEFEFYKFLPPEYLQIFPIGKLFDQIGPIDFNKQAIVFGARFRLMGSLPVQTISYSVFDEDVDIFDDSIQVNQKDVPYIIKFPKGINVDTCKINISSPQVFYRFSVEFKVRILGNETEERYIPVTDVNAK